MSREEIDQYLAALDEPKRSTLAELRATILEVAPDAEEVISYGLPAFKVDGTVIAGFGAFRHHLSYFPHSGAVLAALGEQVAGYRTSRGTLQFRIDTALPRSLVERLIEVRLSLARPSS